VSFTEAGYACSYPAYDECVEGADDKGAALDMERTDGQIPATCFSSVSFKTLI
jgi:hypothetical protein